MNDFLRRCSVSGSKRVRGARSFVALAGVLAAVACSPEESATSHAVADAGKTNIRVTAAPAGESIFGRYLAGRFAENQNDLDFAARMIVSVLEQNPDDKALMQRAFVLTLSAGDTKTAVDLAARLRERGEKISAASLLLAVAEFKQGRHEAALQHVDEMSPSGLGRFSRPLAQAWILAGKGDYDAAFAALEPLSSEQGFAVLHALHAGLIEELAGKLEEAENRYRSAMGEPSEASRRFVRAVASLLQRRGKVDEARELLETQIDDNPDSPVIEDDLRRLAAGQPLPRLAATATEGLAEGLFDLASALPREHVENMVLLYAQIALDLDPDSPVLRLLIGEVLAVRARFREAIATYEAIPATSPYSWAARIRIANALYELDKLDDATALLRTLAKERPERPDPLIRLGDLLRYKERFAEAAEAYDQAFARIGEIRSHHWSLFYSRGITLERSKQWDRAEADFLKALELEPDQPYVLNYLGYSWVEQGRHLDRAREMIETAVQQRQSDGYIVDSLGWVMYRLGQYDEAVRHLERAVQLRPHDPIINDHLGDAYWRVGRRHEARFQWSRALSFDPTPEDAEKIEAKLEKGLGAVEPMPGKRDSGG